MGPMGTDTGHSTHIRAAIRAQLVILKIADFFMEGLLSVLMGKAYSIFHRLSTTF